MGDDTEWMKLPTEDKVQHKSWKARIAGYEEVTKLFQRIDDEKSPEFSKYAGLLKKFVIDNNAFAQEKGLEAVQAFVENAAIAPKTAHDVVNGIITKCLNSTKQKTKDLGKEIIMLYIEAEKQDIVEEDLIEGLGNKNPKVVIGCIACLREGLRDFGNKIVQIKPMIKFLSKLIEDRDKNVREETKQLIVEIYRWIGPAIKPKLADLKPVQLTELEAEFEQLGHEKPHQARFLKSQQDLKAKMEAKVAAGEEEAGDEADDEGGAETVDPYDLIDPVNILPLLPKDFYDKVEAKKWQERREALEALQKLCENPKIEPGDFGPVVKVLQKVIGKDSNVMLVALGGKCLAGLAAGLRKKFSIYAPSCVSVILDKFKEKKPMVVTALREAIDACSQSISLEAIMEDLLAALENKNPSIKAETALFLGRSFCRLTMALLPKKQLKAFCGCLLKTINDTAPEVREASYDALGTAMKVVTEKNIAPFLTDVDNIKMQKIKESCEKAVLLNAKGEPRSGGAKAEGPKAGSAQPKPVARPAAGAEKAAGASKQRPKTAPAKSGGGSKSGAARPGGPPRSKAGPKKGAAPTQEKTEKVLSDDEFLEKAADLLTAELLGQLENSNWKERLAGMEKFTQLVKAMSPKEIPCQICVRAVNKKPGLKETNFQVMKLRVDLICYLAQNAVFTNTSAEFVLGDLVDKVGDVKNGAGCQEALSCIAEATSLEFVSSQVLKLAFAQKNPKNQSESLNWLAKAVTEFGLKIQVKQNIECVKKAFGATNPAVRTGALGLLTVLYRYMGQQLRMFFDDEKPALLQQIDAEFEKVKGEKPPAPTRGVKSSGADDEGEDEEEEAADEEVKMEDLVPRNDIGDRFSPEIINALTDKNWKVRGEALQNVISILNEAKFITGNLGPLPEAIKGRLGDANKNLVTTTIGICVTLATNMGPHCKAHIKTIGPPLIACLGDSKPALRSAAVGALNAWVDQTTLTPLAECEAFSDALKMENPNLRQELLSWLIERLPNHKQLPKDEMKLCVPHLLSCLEDRNGDVRKKGQEALVPFMIHVGYDAVFRATSKLKPASKDQITQIIEKARENLPAKQPKAKKPSAAPEPAAAPAKSLSPDDEDDLDTGKKQKSPTTENVDGKAAKGPGKTKAKAPPPSKRKQVEEDTSPPITVTVTKAQRFKDEKNMKVLKWNFVEPRPEFVEQLKLQMEKNFSKGMMDNLFHADFKFHIKAIETMIKCRDDLQNETIGNLDLILKWFTLRFFDTNPSMLNKGLEYLQGLFTLLADADYQLLDPEANSFLPYLVIKVGENKDNVRRDVRQIFKLIYKVYPASKMFIFISDGIKSKNSKQRTECLEELGYLIETYGITICQPTPAAALKLIAGQISDRDNGVRNAALNSTVVAYLILGDNLYKYIGTLKEKDQSYLDERIKRSSKNRPPPGEQRPKSAPQHPQRSASQTTIQRPHTSMPKSASSNSVRKEFQLEIEDDRKPTNMEMPQLIQYNDLDYLLQPVELPKINARPPSPGPRFMNTADTANTINFVISQVTNRDISTCVEALAQIDEVIKDRDKVQVMTDHVEQLLVAMSMQFKILYTTHMGDEDTPKEDVIRLYRVLLGTLLSLFQNSILATQASKDILKELVNNLVTVLLDNRLIELEDGTQIIRTVNVLVVKIVEKSDQTNILCALVRLLQECAESETCSNKFLDLNMKCLWKMVRMLPDIINELNLDRVLYDIHQFLRKFPSHSWKERSNDLPLRTIKTILHSLAKLRKSKILSHLGQIDAGEVSEVKAYLQKVLKNEGSLSGEPEVNGTEDNKNKNTSAKSSRRLSKATHDLLTEIFKKVGSKENTKEGLQDLYDFKKKYPEADLEPYLKKSSNFFQNYIERGLKAIENEKNEKSSGVSVTDGVRTTVQPLSERSMDSLTDRTRLSKTQQGGDMQSSDFVERAKKLQGQTGVDSNKTVDPGPGVEAGYYMERLRKLRAQCGLDSNPANKGDEPEDTSKEPVKFEIEPEPTIPEPEPDNMATDSSETVKEQNAAKIADVSKLKERLERIKQMANS